MAEFPDGNAYEGASMEIKTDQRIPFLFLKTSLVFLVVGLIFGVVGGLQYIFPSWMKDVFSFARTRPLHVSLVIAWIFTAASGGIYYYLPLITGRPFRSVKLVWLHYFLMLAAYSGMTICYLVGTFGGREYLEFPPWLSVLVFAYWIIFMVSFFRNVFGYSGRWPIYLWMWSTGLLFFLITFTESQLWVISFFRDNIVRDTTVQWKALGSMVGSWNMLVYGTAFYLMEKISGETKVLYSGKTFFFYFLGFTNLMFNWGHHTYIVPASPWVRIVSYAISMTELLILANIIWNWKGTVRDASRLKHRLPIRFLMASEVWIFLNLCLAIILSIPAVNLYTHGTHFTVAHAMGTTIGINTMILLASLFYISESYFETRAGIVRTVFKGFWICNVSLLIFWLSLLVAGFLKSWYAGTMIHQEIIQIQMPFFIVIAVSGLFIFGGIIVFVTPLFRFFSAKN